MNLFKVNKDGIVHAGKAFVGFFTKTKHGEKYFTPRDGYVIGMQALLELHHLLKDYEGE